ncbi:MAG: glycosyltransferase family 4 protein [Thaumarchaeota archaeon]|nr:glycosyltransferase family 4 protein [Nitrososphaerota archaeon]
MSGRLHNFYKSLISEPPAGYRIISKDNYVLRGVRNESLERKFDSAMYYFGRTKIPVKVLKSLASAFTRGPPDSDLVMTSGFINLRNEEWLVWIEDALSSLQGTAIDNKLVHGFIESKLASETCKGILCFNDATRISLLSTYHSGDFKNKIKIVPPSVSLVSRFERPREKKQIDIVFIGSTQFTSTIQFFLRGGHIVVKSFLALAKEFSNIRLWIRCTTPTEYIMALRGEKRIAILGTLDRNSFAALLRDADIFVLPTITTPWTSFLDAMNYGLPIVTVGTHANSEYVENGKSGIVAAVPSALSSITHNYCIPNWNTMHRVLHTWFEDEELVTETKNALRTLIRDADLRNELGREGRRNIEAGGKFSIGRRNQVLKQVLDSALIR